MTIMSAPQTTSQSSQPTIDRGTLQLHDILGIGAYGAVYRATDLASGECFAVKSLSKAGLDPRQRAFQNHEIELHSLVSGHPNIVRLHKVVEEAGDDKNLFMVLDCGQEGDLFYTITERGGFVGNDLAIKSIFGQIASAVLHCHSRGVYHRDLKPENIIMFGSTVKLADFGLATTEPVSSDFGCGSTFYLSPECQGGYVEMVKSYDSAANDVWSLGVILINLVFGRNPWKQACPRDETFSTYVQNNDFLQTILPMSDELNSIVKGVFCLNPKKRISLVEMARRVQACSSFTRTDGASSTAGTGVGAATTLNNSTPTTSSESASTTSTFISSTRSTTSRAYCTTAGAHNSQANQPRTQMSLAGGQKHHKNSNFGGARTAAGTAGQEQQHHLMMGHHENSTNNGVNNNTPTCTTTPGDKDTSSSSSCQDSGIDFCC